MLSIRPIALLAPALALVVAACSGGAAPSAPTPTESAAPTGPVRVEIKLTDGFRIEPSDVSVPVGVPVTFVVTNSGAIDHEFYVGDQAAQDAHAQEMQTMGGMAHDEAMGISLKPGQTKELTITFQSAGALLAGCHVSGHYAAGMKSTITVGGS
ncbi:MAG: putative copper-binding protein [Chloroflexi bacterium]|nr:putative copper-binding protein [Chloroflexota bacterium]